MTQSKFKVGQEVFVTTSNSRQKTYTGVVTKVGRKWLTVERKPGFPGIIDQFCLETRQKKDDNGIPDLVWVSEEEYQSALKRRRAWDKIERYFRSTFRAPNNVSTGELETIAKILKI